MVEPRPTTREITLNAWVYEAAGLSISLIEALDNLSRAFPLDAEDREAHAEGLDILDEVLADLQDRILLTGIEIEQ